MRYVNLFAHFLSSVDWKEFEGINHVSGCICKVKSSGNIFDEIISVFE